MAEPNTIPLPPIPTPFEPQDLDDLIFDEDDGGPSER